MEAEPCGGRRLAGGGRRRGAGGSDHRRRLVLRHAFGRSGQPRGVGGDAFLRRKGRRLPRASAPRIRARSGVRGDACQACLSGPFHVQHGSGAHDPVHPPQPAFARSERDASGSADEFLSEPRDSGTLAGPMNTARSEAWFARAQSRIPGGVNSPVRAFKAVGGAPRFIARGQGSRLFDIDGNAYIDYVGSWGPLILGHGHAAVSEAVRAALEDGTSFGAPTEREVELAELIAQIMPSMEMSRLVNSGTEATMSALRLARGFTGRELTVKFEGCYHGHVDSLLVKAGSGMATLGIADTAGVPAGFAASTIALPSNSVAAAEQAFQRHGGKIACVIVEPVAGNMGCVPPLPGFLE